MLKRFPLRIDSPKTGRNCGVFLGRRPPKKWRLQTLKRHVYETEHVVWAIKRANRSRIDLQVWWGNGKRGEQKSQTRDISPLCGGATCEPISTKLGMFVGFTDVVTYTNNGLQIANGFPGPTYGKTQVSLSPLCLRAYGIYNIVMS